MKKLLATVTISTVTMFIVSAEPTGVSGGTNSGSTGQNIAIGAAVAIGSALGYKYYRDHKQVSPKRNPVPCIEKQPYFGRMKKHKAIRHTHSANGRTKALTHTHAWTGAFGHGHCYGR